MRPSAPAAGRKILLEHVGFIWHHMKFTSKVAVRNLFRYKKRFFMTIFGIGGCTALVVFAFGLTDSISGVAHRQYDELFHYDMTLTLDDNAILGGSEGNDSVVIYVEATRAMKKLPANKNVKADQTLVQILGSAFGEENVKVV